MIFWKNNRLYGKCDCCGITIEGYEGETDQLEFTCGFYKEYGWLQRKEGEKWKHYCPECKEAFYKAKREKYFAEKAANNGF